MSKKSERETAKQEAIERLRQILKPGDRVFGIVRTVSRSGMSRTIDFYTFGPDGDRTYLSGYIANACDYSRTRDGAIRVGGCGMDMIFHTVYNLGRVLFPRGFGVPCHNSEHSHRERRPQSPEHARRLHSAGCAFSGRNHDRSGWDNDGGYALKHEQL